MYEIVDAKTDLPLAVFDSVKEVEEYTGVGWHAVMKAIREERVVQSKYKIYRIESGND